MSNNSKQYSELFKYQIIDLNSADKSVTKLVKEYSLFKQIIYKCKKLYAPSITLYNNQTFSIKDFQK